MKIEVLSLTEEAIEKRDYRSALGIKVDGQMMAEFWDGEPEDANLSRDFSDCNDIPSLMQQAYEAGKAGEVFSITFTETEEF